METRSNHILVGSVVMGALVAVVLFIVWLSNAGGEQDRKYDILFRQAVDGLAKGSAGTFSGGPVGQGDSINPMPPPPESVRGRTPIDEGTPWRGAATGTPKG